MAGSLEKQTQYMLRSGIKKEEILKKLATDDNRAELILHLNNLPTETHRRQNIWINWLLLVFLFVVTSKKIYLIAILITASISYDQFTPVLLLNLIVPAINFYILREILLFRRRGYLFLAVVSVLALIRAENRITPDLYLYLTMAGVAVFILLRMFPRKEKLQ